MGIDDEIKLAEDRMDKAIQSDGKATAILVPVAVAIILALLLFAGH